MINEELENSALFNAMQFSENSGQVLTSEEADEFIASLGIL